MKAISPSDNDSETTPTAKRLRISFTNDQKFHLESSFAFCKYPDKNSLHKLAELIGISPEKKWVKNY